MLVVQPGAPYDMTLAGQKRTLPITFSLAKRYSAKPAPATKSGI